MKKQHLLWVALCLATAQAWGQGIIASGTCGAEGDGSNLAWVLTDDGTLTISGEGEMADYSTVTILRAPWAEFREKVKLASISEGVTTVGAFAFYDCANLASCSLPMSLDSISHGAFQDCNALTSVVIPDGVKYLGYGAFFWCKGLLSIDLPATLEVLDSSAFASCTSLQQIMVHAITPPRVVDMYVFENVNTSIPVYVPAESIENYRAALYWSAFDDFLPIEGEDTGITFPSLSEAITVAGGEVHLNLPGTFEAQVYDLQGRCVLRATESRFALPQGSYIIKVGDEAVKVAL